MEVWEAVAHRIRQLCRENGVTPNRMSKISGVPQATTKSILLGESKNPGTVAVKRLCDGFGITLGKGKDYIELKMSFFAWVESHRPEVTAKCKLREAMDYALNGKKTYYTYLENGLVSQTNAAAENSIRLFAAGRENWLFSSSPKGADASVDGHYSQRSAY